MLKFAKAVAVVTVLALIGMVVYGLRHETAQTMIVSLTIIFTVIVILVALYSKVR